MKFSAVKKPVLAAYYSMFAFGGAFLAFCVYLTIRKDDPVSVTVFFAIMCALMFSFIIWDKNRGIGSEHFVIDETGVAYEKSNTRYFMPWESVADIALMPDSYGRLSKISFIMFVSGNDTILLTTRRDKFNEDAFGVQYRKGIADAIRNYTDLPIRYIDRVEGQNNTNNAQR